MNSLLSTGHVLNGHHLGQKRIELPHDHIWFDSGIEKVNKSQTDVPHVPLQALMIPIMSFGSN